MRQRQMFNLCFVVSYALFLIAGVLIQFSISRRLRRYWKKPRPNGRGVVEVRLNQ